MNIFTIKYMEPETSTIQTLSINNTTSCREMYNGGTAVLDITYDDGLDENLLTLISGSEIKQVTLTNQEVSEDSQESIDTVIYNTEKYTKVMITQEYARTLKNTSSNRVTFRFETSNEE